MSLPSCEHCHTSWQDVQDSGLLGCPHCYTAFADRLEMVAKSLHHDTAHVGKIPSFRLQQEQLQEILQQQKMHRKALLENRLREAISTERHDEVIHIRGKLSQI